MAGREQSSPEMEVKTMQEAVKNRPREAREEMIDSLIAVSLLTRRMAGLLIGMNTSQATTAKKGECTYGNDERAGRPACRVVGA